MLVLTRHPGQRIIIGDNIAITIVDVRGGQVRIGVEAPKEVPVHREEIAKRIARQERKAGAA